MGERLRPADAGEVQRIVAWAAGDSVPLEVIGGATKRRLGRPLKTAHTLDLSGLSGISLYEPEELVLTAGPGTRLADIEAQLTANGQALAFEPPDFGPLLSAPAGAATIGGIVACNLAGPRRLKSGAVRDHVLGVHAVSGRGENFKTGGRVVKNVTGYDLCKVLTGSYGTLAAMTEVTVKVLPAAEAIRTVLITGLPDADAIRAMSVALNGSHEVSGAARTCTTIPRSISTNV